MSAFGIAFGAPFPTWLVTASGPPGSFFNPEFFANDFWGDDMFGM